MKHNERRNISETMAPNKLNWFMFVWCEDWYIDTGDGDWKVFPVFWTCFG